MSDQETNDKPRDEQGRFTAPETEAAPEGEVKEYSYQPMDDEGRAIGGRQVVHYHNEQELADEMAKRHVESMKYARKLKRDVTLGQLPAEDVPTDAQRYDTNSVEFKPRNLTAEEKWDIARGLSDPNKFDESLDRALEARIGGSPQLIAQTLQQAREDIMAMRAEQEAKAFIDGNPSYYVCEENSKTLMAYMAKNNLAPTKTNFRYAFQKLDRAELLLPAPDVATEHHPNTQGEPEVGSRITPDEQGPAKRVVPASGLSKSNSSNAGGSATRKLTNDDVRKMTADEYNEKVLKPLLRQSMR